jgi:hypothetical protein
LANSKGSEVVGTNSFFEKSFFIRGKRAPLFSTIIAGVDPLCDTNGHEERTQAAEMQKRRAKILFEE